MNKGPVVYTQNPQYMYDQSYQQPPQQSAYNPAYQPSQPFISPSAPTMVVTSYETEKKDYDTALLMLVIGFFFPIVWIVSFAMTRNQGERARKLGNVSCLLMVGSTIFVIFFAVILPIIIVSSASANIRR